MLYFPELFAPASIVRGAKSRHCSVAIDLNPDTHREIFEYAESSIPVTTGLISSTLLLVKTLYAHASTMPQSALVSAARYIKASIALMLSIYTIFLATIAILYWCSSGALKRKITLKRNPPFGGYLNNLGERGLEPPRIATPDPKSGASTIPPLALIVIRICHCRQIK